MDCKEKENTHTERKKGATQKRIARNEQHGNGLQGMRNTNSIPRKAEHEFGVLENGKQEHRS